MKTLTLLMLWFFAGTDVAAAPPITAQNALESERFWPYQVALARPVQKLSAGTVGVLIRIEPKGLARIDFGRDGLHTLPLEATDLIARANRVRLGELHKEAPHFVWTIGSRLLDSTTRPLQALRPDVVAKQRAFLCVFADPHSSEFASIARALTPLRDRPGVMTILFPQAKRADQDVHERLRLLGWRVPFVYDHLAEPYTRSLLDRSVSVPAVILQTAEGRVLVQRAWAPSLVSELSVALDEL